MAGVEGHAGQEHLAVSQGLLQPDHTESLLEGSAGMLAHANNAHTLEGLAPMSQQVLAQQGVPEALQQQALQQQVMDAHSMAQHMMQQHAMAHQQAQQAMAPQAMMHAADVSGMDDVTADGLEDLAAEDGLGGGDKGVMPVVSRAAIINEVESAMAGQLSEMGEEGLHSWLAQLQGELSHASDAHHKAKDALKQVDQERALARDAFRADQGCSEKHRAWKSKVSQLKEWQETLRVAKEQYYRKQAAVEAVTREIKRRTKREGTRSTDGEPRTSTAKRRKSSAPEESCPYCQHTYTVRDGLSTKQDAHGNRLHMRKCQCREKTPPCRNCPKCKENQDIMAINDPHLQFQMCQQRFKCEICACRCPGAGKWVETDEESRRSYAQRTQQRHAELNALGWYNITAAQIADRAAQGGGKKNKGKAQTVSPAPPELAKNKVLRRLPADIRAQMELLQNQQGGLGVLASTGLEHTMQPYAQMIPPMGGPMGGHQHMSTDPSSLLVSPGPGPDVRPPPDSKPVEKPPPELPHEVAALCHSVFDEPAGAEGVALLKGYLQAQRVTSLADLQFLQLDWLQAALAPLGLPELLLNKFLQSARSMAGMGPDPLLQQHEAAHVHVQAVHAGQMDHGQHAQHGQHMEHAQHVEHGQHGQHPV